MSDGGKAFAIRMPGAFWWPLVVLVIGWRLVSLLRDIWEATGKLPGLCMFALLLVGCGGRTFDGSAADAGAQLEEVRPSDAGEEHTGEGPAGEQPRAAQDGSTAPTVEPESLSQPLADALATLEPATQDASADTPQAPTDAATDAGRHDSAPELEEPEPAPEPSPLEEHLAQLEEQGLAVESCRGLVQSVEACCGELAGVAFSCDARGCSCEGTFTNYPAAQSLCSTSPAVPFRWECSP